MHFHNTYDRQNINFYTSTKVIEGGCILIYGDMNCEKYDIKTKKEMPGKQIKMHFSRDK
jgi:hypothetical protein